LTIWSSKIKNQVPTTLPKIESGSPRPLAQPTTGYNFRFQNYLATKKSPNISQSSFQNSNRCMKTKVKIARHCLKWMHSKLYICLLPRVQSKASSAQEPGSKTKPLQNLQGPTLSYFILMICTALIAIILRIPCLSSGYTSHLQRMRVRKPSTAAYSRTEFSKCLRDKLSQYGWFSHAVFTWIFRTRCLARAVAVSASL